MRRRGAHQLRFPQANQQACLPPKVLYQELPNSNLLLVTKILTALLSRN